MSERPSALLEESEIPATPEPWYHRAFGPAYLDHYAHRDDREAERVAEFLHARLGFSSDARLLDLCCGAGRHLAHLAPRAGAAFGLDLSPDLLRRAGQRRIEARVAEPENASLPASRFARAPFELVEADMRRLPFADRSFDVIVNLFTSFGYFEEEEENQRVLSEVARALTPGGSFAIDHINRPHLLRHLRGESERVWEDGARALERREFDPHASRVVKRVRRFEPDGVETRWVESVRVYSREDLEGALEAAGLRPFDARGDYDGSPLRETSPRMILFARRVEDGPR